MNLPFSKIRNFILIAAIVVFCRRHRVSVRSTEGEYQHKPGKAIDPESTKVPATAPVDFALFWDVWGRLFRFYIDRASMDPQKMVWGAITGMVNSLGDPYTTFYPRKKTRNLRKI